MGGWPMALPTAPYRSPSTANNPSENYTYEGGQVIKNGWRRHRPAVTSFGRSGVPAGRLGLADPAICSRFRNGRQRDETVPVVSVALRPIEEADLDRLLTLMWDRDAAGEFQWFGFRAASTRELRERWQTDGLISRQHASFLAVETDGADLAGWVDWRGVGNTGTVEIGIALFPEQRGRGVGTQAQRQLVSYLFDTTPVHRIQAGTEVDNIAEQRALEQVGFQREGVQRGLYFRAGEWRDSAMYAIFRSEYDKPETEQ